jgi:CybS, succinate dehydrogenase cytochrome B small subunit
LLFKKLSTVSKLWDDKLCWCFKKHCANFNFSLNSDLFFAIYTFNKSLNLKSFFIITSGTIRTSHVWSKGQLNKSLFKHYPAAGLLAKDNVVSIIPPRREMSGGDHVTLWTIERALSLGLLGIIPAAFIMPSPAMDYLLAVSLVMHSHW